jgi:hypothetical protein
MLLSSFRPDLPPGLARRGKALPRGHPTLSFMNVPLTRRNRLERETLYFE